jgi:hypothetical protein
MASLPILFGLHQLDETFVWWWLQGHISASVGRPAMWIYLIFALVILPTLIPLLVYYFEPTRRRRWRIVPFSLLGVGVSAVLLEAMLADPISAHLGTHHIGYSVGLQHGVVVIGLYILATCGSLLASGFRPVILFGFANVAAVIALALLSADGFTSLWCFYAALVSGAIAFHIRFGHPHPRRLLRHRAHARTDVVKEDMQPRLT